MMDGIALANNIAVGLYGMILSAAFCDMTWTARRRWVFTGCMAAILALQGVVTWRFAAETTRCLYPLITHLPLVVTLGVMNRRALWPTIAVLTAYLCCQLRRWIALLIVALLHSGDAMQSIAELIVTLPLLLALLRFVAPAVRKGSRFPRIMQWEFGVIPALGYAFDYLTRVYTDLLVQGVPAAVEFMPFVCCVAYLIFVLHSAAENEERSRLERTRESLDLQIAQAMREISSLRESERQGRIYRHDLRHHMQYLDACIENGRTAQAREYIHQICRQIETRKVETFCENEAANLIFSSFHTRAEDMSIPLQIRAQIPQVLPVAESDLCVLLSNALENALRACRAAQEQGLPCDADVMAYEKDGSLFLQISNACAGEVLFENGVPVTHVSGHGIGVQSICGIVERYGGVYDFSLRDGRFILRVSL